MFYRLIIFVLCVIHLNQAWSQIDSLRLESSFDLPGDIIEVDPLLQIYTLDAQQYLRKYNQSGQLLFSYQNKNLGRLERCDANNPFNILLFYPDFNTLLILDRTLNPLVEINLDALGFFAIQLVATAADNKIWLYDPEDFKLKKVNTQGQILAASQDLSLQFPNGLNWQAIRVVGDEVIIQSSDQLLLLFNQFGQWIKSINIAPGTFQWKKQQVYLLEDAQGVFIYEPLSGRSNYLYQRSDPEEDLFLIQKKLLVQKGRHVKILSW